MVRVAGKPLPDARPQPETLDKGREEGRHQFALPESTTGMEKGRKKRLKVAVPVAKPVLLVPRPPATVFALPPAPGQQPQLFAIPHQLATPSPPVPTFQSQSLPFSVNAPLPLPHFMPPLPVHHPAFSVQPLVTVPKATMHRWNKLGMPVHMHTKATIICNKCKKDRKGDSTHHNVHKKYRWCEVADAPVTFDQFKAEKDRMLKDKQQTGAKASELGEGQ